ncbi:MAG: serine protease [Armatimonadota bacterium]|nr:serine protease [Armatimonadota bacterium]
MWRLKGTALVLAVAMTIAVAPARANITTHLQAKDALVLIETPGGTGSGFIVSPTLVATACHVVKGAAAIQVHFWAARSRAAGRQLLCDERRDIAFIATSVPEGAVKLEFSGDKVAQGEQIWVWGFPLGTTIATEPSVSAGIVSATETAQGFIALDVSGAPGNSGGPVVNGRGKVVGIFVASWNVQGQGTTGFKYAASGVAAESLLRDTTAQTSLDRTGEPPAEADTVRPGDGIGGVKIGMTPAQAQQAVGLPPSSVGGGWHEWNTRKLSVYFDGGKALFIVTANPAIATLEGVRVGSTDVDLIKAYGAPVCASVGNFRGSALLGWYYEGMIVLLEGSPRKTALLVVIPKGAARAICR